MNRCISSLWRWATPLSVVASALSLCASLSLAAPMIVTGSSEYKVVEPRGTAKAKAPNQYLLKVTFPDPADNTKHKTVDVPVPAPGEPDLVPWPAKLGETKEQASLRKAEAIKKAFEAAAKAGTIPASVTATPMPTQVPVWDGTMMPNPFFHTHPPFIHNPANAFTHTPFNHTQAKVPDYSKTKMVPGYAQVKYDGISKSPRLANDPTKEGGNGLNFTPGKSTPTQPSKSYSPGMSGNGSSMGFSLGIDPLGEQSIVSFGFYDDLAGTDPEPKLYIAGVQPISGQPESEVMETLVGLFNFQFAPSYSLQYDEDERTLFLNQELDWNNTFFFGNTDIGLDFSFFMTPVPEPSTLVLALVALVCLPGWIAAGRTRRR